MDSVLASLPADPVLAFAGALFAKRMGVPLPALPFLLLGRRPRRVRPCLAWLAVRRARARRYLREAADAAQAPGSAPTT